MYGVYEAVNAQQPPTPQDTSYVEDEIRSYSPEIVRVVEASWYRINGPTVEILHHIECTGPPSDTSDWLAVLPDGTGSFVPQVTVADLLPAMHVA